MTYRILNRNDSLKALLLIAPDGFQFWIPESWYDNGNINEQAKEKERKARSEGMNCGDYAKPYRDASNEERHDEF